MNSKRFTIYGSCVTRDIFNFLDNELYIPQLTLGGSSISTLFGISLNISKEDICGDSNFIIRSIDDVLNKKVVSRFKETDSEYFIFDLANERLPIQTWNLDGVSSEVPVTWNTYKAGIKLKENEKYRALQISNWHLNDANKLQWERNIKLFCDEIKQKYPPEKIIYISLQQVDELIDENNSRIISFTNDKYETHQGIDNFSLRERGNEIIHMAEKIVLERMPDCWVIEMPEHAVGNINHHFSPHPLHFDYLLYEYFAEAIKYICKDRKYTGYNEDKKIVNKNLYFLKRKYTSMFIQKRAIFKEMGNIKIQFFCSSACADIFESMNNISFYNPICDIGVDTLDNETTVLALNECKGKLQVKEMVSLLNDINKHYKEVLLHGDAQWILIDLLAVCRDRLEIRLKEKTIQIMDKYSDDVMQLLYVKFVEQGHGTIKKVSWRDEANMMEEKIKNFAKFISGKYRPEQIIVNELYFHESFVDDNYKVVSYGPEIKEMNLLLARCYQFIYSIIPNCKKIMPVGGISYVKNVPDYISVDEERYYKRSLAAIIHNREEECIGLYKEYCFRARTAMSGLKDKTILPLNQDEERIV